MSAINQFMSYFDTEASRSWPNAHTGLTSILVINDVACLIFKNVPTLVGLNLVIRALRFCLLVHHRDARAAGDVVAAVALSTLRAGGAVATATNGIIEFINYFRRSSSEPGALIPRQATFLPSFRSERRLDPTVRANAMTILGLSEEQMNDKAVIEEAHRKVGVMLDDRISTLPAGVIRSSILELRRDIDTALCTLSQ